MTTRSSCAFDIFEVFPFESPVLINNIRLSRSPVPLKVKEIHLDNIWVTVQGCPCLYPHVPADQWNFKVPEHSQYTSIKIPLKKKHYQISSMDGV